MKATTFGLLFVTFFVLCAVGVSAQLFEINLSRPLNNTYLGNQTSLLFLEVNVSGFANISNVTWALIPLYDSVRVNYTFSNTTVNLTFYGRSIDTTTIADGRYNITANATNNTGSNNVSYTKNSTYQGAGFNITIDNTAPNATILSPINFTNIYFNGTYIGNNNRTVNFTFTVTDNLDTLIVAVIVIDGNTSRNFTNVSNGTTAGLIVNLTDISEGFHNWTINVIDEASNNGSTFPNITIFNRVYVGGAGIPAVVNFTIDRSAPVFITQTGANLTPTNNSFIRGASAGGQVNFTFQIIDRFVADNLSASIMVDSVAYNTSTDGIANNTNVTFNITLTNGIHYWNVTTNDTIGNNSNISATLLFTFDSATPNITLNFPTEGQLLSAGGTALNWTVTDNLDSNLSTNITINGVVGATGVASTNGTTSQYITFLEEGAYNWSITVTDEAGNINTSITINFTIRAVSGGAGGTGSGGGAGSRTTRQALPADGLILTVFTTGRVSVEVDGTYQLLDLIRTKNNEEADITFGTTRATLAVAQPTSLDVDGDGAYDVTVTATNVYSKRTDLRIVPLGQALHGQATLPTHVIPRRVAFGNTPTGNTLAPSSDSATGSSPSEGSASGSPEGEEGTGLEGVTGEVVGDVAGTGGFSVVMLIISVLVLFAVVGLIYYLYREH